MTINGYNVSAPVLKNLLEETLVSINGKLHFKHNDFNPIKKVPESLVDEKAMKRLVSTFPPVWEPKLKSFDYSHLHYSEEHQKTTVCFFMCVAILGEGIVKYPLGKFCYSFKIDQWSKL